MPSVPETVSAYYQHSTSVPLASRLSLMVRRKMFKRFLEVCMPTCETRVLDVGVTSDCAHPESNYFEQLYPHAHRLICVGTENGSHLEQQFPGLKYRDVEAGQPLPFEDGEFDVVFSNAVLEHVGSTEQQMWFLQELCRVAKQFFVTTPNRWFPVEHHTGLPLLHYLPAPAYRALVAQTKYKYWADESHLNILTAASLRKILPASADCRVEAVSLFGIPSNLIAYGTVHS